jgi:hypothetical protein
MEQAAVQHCGKRALQALQVERVTGSELNFDSTAVGFLSSDLQCRFSHINTHNRYPERGDVKSVLAGPATDIEHRSGEPTLRSQASYRRLRLANIPRAGPLQ